MNISQLREAVTRVLSASPNLVGSYTLPDSSTIPSIYVVGRQSVPKDWKVDGIEVTMREFPELAPRSAVGGTVKVAQVWEVILVQYTPNSNKLGLAIDRMIRRFPDATPRYFPGDDIAYERCRFLIPDMVIQHLLAS